MSKAEEEEELIEKARKFSLACATSLERNGKSLCCFELDMAYIKGYHQVEKDFELTWEDISVIRQIIFDYNRQVRNEMTIPNNEEYCQEVLKRFKERKEL